MISASRTREQLTRLIMGNSRKNGYTEVDSKQYYCDDDDDKRIPRDNSSSLSNHRSRLVAIIALLVGFAAGNFLSSWQNQKQLENGVVTSREHIIRNHNGNGIFPKKSPCRFCDQSPPILHHDRSYTILIPNDNEQANIRTSSAQDNNKIEHNESIAVTVTPMTVVYDYELYDGENLFTYARTEHIPNLEMDYAVLGIGGARNTHRETGTDVSLDEVYVHHFTLQPINMLGAEVLNRKFDDNDYASEDGDPYLRFPDGYAIHILADEKPFLGANSHLLSNKNLEPIDGSLERAHKECNECYYAPGKGSECTPEVSGTFLCCGDSRACMKEDCACKTTTTPTKTSKRRRTTTKYRFELDLLVALDAVDKFKRVDQWNFAAPGCSINIMGDAILKDYPPDNYCAKRNTNHSMNPALVLWEGGGSLFHQVPEQTSSPYVRTVVNVMAPGSGKLVWAQSHLHTGGINATLYKNGEIICTNQAIHGANDDANNNARNEHNHLVKITSCYEQMKDEQIRFDAGDVFRTESYYYGGTNDDRFSTPLAAGEHKNAMSMFFTGVVFDGTSDFLTKPRTSFNLWNDFEHVAGVNYMASNRGSNK